VLYFPDEADLDTAVYGEDFVELSKNAAVFIRMPYTADREKSPWTVESEVPVNKLQSDNPAREFNIPVGRVTIVVCDWYGNEVTKLNGPFRAQNLQRAIEGVARRVADSDRRLQRNYDRAKEAAEKDDRRGALRHISSNFREGLVGLPAQEATIRLYHDILDAARTEATKLSEEGDVEGLRRLATDFRRTALEKEIEEAIKSADRS
jgi:hypothetical protein